MKNIETAMVNPFAMIDERLRALEGLALEFYSFIQSKKNGSQNSDKPLSIDEASDYLGIPKPTLYRLTSRQEIPFCKKGKQLFFFQEELKEWLKTGRQCTIAEIRANAKESFNQLNGGL